MVLVVRRGEWEAIEAEAPWNLEKGECTGTEEVRWLPDSHVSAAPVRLNAKCKAASRQYWARSRGGGAGWHSTPSYASWVTEIKTNLERCMVNGASTPSSSFSLALPSTHPHSSSPTISSTPTLPPTHLRDCGCCSIIATPHISTSLPLQTFIQRGIFFF